MLHRCLDRWDEQRAARSDSVKLPSKLVVGSKLAFPNKEIAKSVDEFGDLASLAATDLSFFQLPYDNDTAFEKSDGWLQFPSPLLTATTANNTVWVKITGSKDRGQALIVFHHWNATKRNRQLAQFFAKQGITVFEIAMPYHLERSSPGAAFADHMLSPNIGQTLQSVRQAVLDGRKLIKWLVLEEYDDISVLGMSLGSWIAGLVAAHDETVSRAALFLTAGNLADMVWTGRATRHIRASLEPDISVADLRRAWSPINLETYSQKLARPDLSVQLILGNRDKVVLPKLSWEFVEALKSAGAKPDIQTLNCGHYSLALPPFIIRAGLRVRKLIKDPDALTTDPV